MTFTRPSAEFLESVIWPALLLAGGIVLLQVHAMPYWQARAGQVLGVLWSLQLEGTALWLLYQPGKDYKRLGVITSILLVGVPIWQLSQPAIERIETAQADSSAQAASLAGKAEGRRDDQIATLKAKVESYRGQLTRSTDALTAAAGADPAYLRQLAKDQARAQFRLDGAEKALDAKQDDQTRSAPARSGGVDRMGWLRAAADIAPGAASLLLFQTVNVLIIVSISRYRHGAYESPAPPPATDSGRPPEPPPSPRPTPRPATETAVSAAVSAPPAPAETVPAPEMKPAGESPVSVKPPPAPTAPPAPGIRGTTRPLRLADEMTIHRLKAELIRRFQAAGMTRADWLRAEQRAGRNIAPRDLSFLMNHFERAKKGEETISAPKLAQLVAWYLPHPQEGTGA